MPLPPMGGTAHLLNLAAERVATDWTNGNLNDALEDVLSLQKHEIVVVMIFLREKLNGENMNVFGHRMLARIYSKDLPTSRRAKALAHLSELDAQP